MSLFRDSKKQLSRGTFAKSGTSFFTWAQIHFSDISDFRLLELFDATLKAQGSKRAKSC